MTNDEPKPGEEPSENSEQPPTQPPDTQPEAVASEQPKDTQPKKQSRFVKFLWSAGKISLICFLFVVSVFGIYCSSPASRAMVSRVLNLLHIGDSYGGNVNGPASITTQERFWLDINATYESFYEVKIYKKELSDYKNAPAKIDPLVFKLAPAPAITSSEAFKLLEGKRPVYSRKGRLEYTDLMKARAFMQMDQQLPPGDYIYSVEQGQGDDQHGTNNNFGYFTVTNLGLIVKEAADKAIVKVVDLNTLAPVAGADVELFKATQWSLSQEERDNQATPAPCRCEKTLTAKTNAAGIAEIPCDMAQLEHDTDSSSSLIWTAATKDDFTAQWSNFGYYSYPFDRWQSSQTMSARYGGSFPEKGYSRNTYIVSDRSAYRLGQEVYLKGVTRYIGLNGLQNEGANQTVGVTIVDPENHDLSKLSLKTGPFGDFNFHFTIPADGHTGTYCANIKYPDGTMASKTIDILQYRKPEFLVELVPDSEHTVAGNTVKAKIKAKYFFGGPVKGATVDYRIQQSVDYAARNALKELPPGAEFFNEDIRQNSFSNYYSFNPYYQPPIIDNQTGKALTNDAGEAEITIKTKAVTESKPFSDEGLEKDYIVSATVTDLSRKVVEGSGTALVTPSDAVLVVSSTTRVLSAGEHLKARVRACDYDNKPLSGQTIKLSLETWRFDYNKGSYVYEKSLPIPDMKTGADGVVSIDAPLPADCPGGQYMLHAQSADSKGAKCNDYTEIWVEGNEVIVEDDTNQEIRIVTDKDVYKVGEKVRAMIQLPSASGTGKLATGLATIDRRTVQKFQSLDFDRRQKIVEFPIEANSVPNVILSVCTVDKKHRFQAKEKLIFVYPESKLLDVTIKADKEKYEPGQDVTLEVTAKHKDGKPAAQTQLSLSVADESIYSIRPDTTADISHNFYTVDRDWTLTRYNFSPLQDTSTLSNTSPAIFSLDELKLAFGMPIDGTVRRTNLEYAANVFSLAPGGANSENGYGGGFYSYGGYGGAPMLQGATNGTIGPQGGDATVIMGVNTAGTVKASDGFFSAREAAPSPAPMAAPAGPPPAAAFPKEIELRKDFKDLAYWSPNVVTDSNGVAHIKMKAPDNLTTWRATLKAISQNTDTGQDSTKFRVTKDVLARLSLPRFFTDRDEGVVTGIVHNYTDKAQKINIELSPSKLIEIGKPARQQLDVPPEGAGRFTWPVKIIGTGKAEISLKAAGETKTDGVLEKIPVKEFCYPAFACKNGILKEDSESLRLPLKLAKDARPNTAKFKANFSASAIGPVLGNFDKLIEYPYGCTEQTMSRMVPGIVAMQLHKKLGVPMSETTRGRFFQTHQEGIKKIIAYQNGDGGWGWWGSDATNLYLTSYVLEGLHMLREAGFTCDQSLVDSGTRKMDEMTSAWLQPDWQVESATDHAYALYVMSLFGTAPQENAVTKQMINITKLPPEGLAYLTLAMHNSGREQQAKAAYARLLELSNKNWDLTNWDHTPELYEKMGVKGEYSYRFTGTEATSLALRTALAMEPKNEKLHTSIRRWLLFRHDEDGWSNTKTTAGVFLALLADELNSSAGQVPNFKADAQVAGQTLAAMLFDKKNRYAAEQTIAFAVKATDEFIEIKKQGPGRLYYNSTLTYDRPIQKGMKNAPMASPPDLLVERQFYKFVTHPDETTHTDVTTLEPMTDGSTVSAGDNILMRISIKSPVAVPYVMVDAGLPSGAEVVTDPPNFALRTTNGEALGWSYWWTHQDTLDDRIVFFVTSLNNGECSFQSILRMEMPGKFNVVPVKLEGMYTEAIRGYSAPDFITVKEK